MDQHRNSHRAHDTGSDTGRVRESHGFGDPLGLTQSQQPSVGVGFEGGASGPSFGSGFGGEGEDFGFNQETGTGGPVEQGSIDIVEVEGSEPRGTTETSHRAQGSTRCSAAARCPGIEAPSENESGNEVKMTNHLFLYVWVDNSFLVMSH